MKIFPIRAFNDNYIWAIHHPNSNKLLVVDPGDAQPVIDYIETQQLDLVGILITHYHNDHIGGVKDLKDRYQCPAYGSSYDALDFCDQLLSDKSSLSLFDEELQFQVLHVPGHTLGHIAYFEANHKLLFCGDTLFRAGCGRMFEGEPEQFYQSLQTLSALPADTQVYCTHEYTLSNLTFAKYIEPDNQDIQNLIEECQELRQKDQVTLPSTIQSEHLTNPFLRCHLEPVSQRVNQLAQRNDKQEYEIFASMRRIKDNF